MSKKSFNTIFLFLAFAYGNEAFCQSGFSFTPVAAAASPNTASLGMYGEMPVSLFTGLPQISVPIGAMSLKGITLPIAARYHASGTKIDQHPSWIGMGWSLEAGGSIDRVQHGVPDEKNYFEPPTSGGILRGFYKTHSLIDSSDWASTFLTTDIRFDGSDNLLNDLEPDEFRFSYPGNSGSFFLNEKGIWCVQSDKPVKVLREESEVGHIYSIGIIPSNNYTFSNEQVFKKFTLIDGFGYKYVFGGNPTSIELSDRYYPQLTNRNYFSATSWKLTRIIAPSGEELFELGYERGPTVIQLYISAFYKSLSMSAGGAICATSVNSWTTSNGYPVRGNLVSPVYLKYVKSLQLDRKWEFITEASNEMSYIDPSGDPNLTQNNPYLSAFVGTYMDENNGINPSPYGITPGDFLEKQFLDGNVHYFKEHESDAIYWKNIIWLKLEKVKITDASGAVLRNVIKFQYDNGPNERLRLFKISYEDNQGGIEKKYEFKYNNQTVGRYLTSVGDHWGYNNNGPYLPTLFLNLPTIQNYRQPSLQYTQAGVLTEIIYPTGGNTKFEYELNECSKVVNYEDRSILEDYTSSVGGLRIKKVTNNDGSGGVTTKEYYYVKDYRAGRNHELLFSSGILQNRPKYDENFSGVSLGQSFSYQSYQSMPAIALTEFSTGNYIGYSEVVEKQENGSFTIYNFTNHDNGYPDERYIETVNGKFNYQLPVSSRAHERGKLLKQSLYTNTDSLVSQTINKYTRSNINDYARTVRSNKDEFCRIASPTHSYSTVWNYFHKTAYKLFYNSLNLTSSVKKEYAPGSLTQFMETRIEYEYNANGDLSLETLTGSTGGVIKRQYLYPADFSSVEPYLTMISRHIVSPRVEELTYKDNVFLKTTKTNYGFWNGNSWSVTPTTVIVPKLVETKAFNEADFEPRANFLSYDDKGNVTSASKENDVKTSYVWGYNQSLPIAVVANSEYLTGNFVDQTQSANLHYVGDMGHNVVYVLNGSASFSQSATVSLSRTYYKANDHSTLFTLRIYNGNHVLVKSYTDNVPTATTEITLTDEVTLPAGNYTVEVSSNYEPAQSGILFNQEAIVEMYGTSYKPWVFPLHTSFEEDDQSVSLIYHKTGNKCHVGSYVIPVPPSTSGYTKVKISYWAKTTSSSPWTYFEEIVNTGAGSNKTIGNGQAFVDEVRMYPINGQMTTHTYDRLSGMTSQTDINNKTIFYGYDRFNRLVLIRDDDGNILKKFCYSYEGQLQDCNETVFTNDLQVRTFTRNNCAVGLISPTYTYSVPANTFSSTIDKATANQMAINSMTVPGQAAANALPCLAPLNGWNKTSNPYNVTITNSVGTPTFNQTYSFYPGSAASILGNLPTGSYNFSVGLMYGGSTTVELIINGTSYSGASFSVNNVVISGISNITLQTPAAPPGPCFFSMGSGFSTPTNGIGNGGTTVNGYMVFYYSAPMYPGNSYLLATINGSCRPSVTRTFMFNSAGRLWTATVYPSGGLFVQIGYGSATLTPYTTISFSFLYNL